MTHRIALHVALLALVAWSAPGALASAPPDWIAEVIADRAAAHGVSAAVLTAVADCETGGTWDPRSVGAAGELGIYQLHPAGELRTFYARGYADPFDVWESADFAAARFSEGGAAAWSCWRRL